jgi:hypothetical protein
MYDCAYRYCLIVNHKCSLPVNEHLCKRVLSRLELIVLFLPVRSELDNGHRDRVHESHALPLVVRGLLELVEADGGAASKHLLLSVRDLVEETRQFLQEFSVFSQEKVASTDAI